MKENNIKCGVPFQVVADHAYALLVELVDMLDLESSAFGVRVRVS